MKTPLQNQFETQLKALTGFDFQNTVAKIFQLRYGETDFTPLRPQKDKGNDGIIESEKRVIACFGPKEERDTRKRLNDFEKKVKSDFNSYKNNWQSNYPNWSIVINHQIDPKYDDIVKGLMPNANATVIGLDQLLSMIDNLHGHQKRQIGEMLRIDKEYFSADYLKDILEDFLKESEISERSINYDRSTYIQTMQKIELNYDEADIQAAIDEYCHFAENGYLKLVDNLMSGYNDEEINRMKSRIIYDYKYKTNGDFKVRLKHLLEYYLVTYLSENDDNYRHCINAVLIYLFEQCLIGNKVREI
jgi:hypothetical protein